MAYLIGGVKLNKWQLALAIGTPLAVSIGMYIFNKSIPMPKFLVENTSMTPKTIQSTTVTTPTVPTSSVTNNENENENVNVNANQIQGKPNVEIPQEINEVDVNVDVDVDVDNDADVDEEMSDDEGRLCAVLNMSRNEFYCPILEEDFDLRQAQTYKEQGNLSFRDRKFHEAIAFYNKAIKACPPLEHHNLAIFYQNRAAANEMLLQWDEVREDCSRSLELNARYTKAYQRRARANEMIDNLSDCLDDITAACVLESFQNTATTTIAERILRERGRRDAQYEMETREPIMPSSYFIATYLMTFTNDPIQLISMPVERTEVEATSIGFWRARCALEAKEYEAIIPACSEEIQHPLSAHKLEAYLLRGTFLYLCGALNESCKDFDAIINNPTADINLSCHALIKRASVLIEMDKIEFGLADFMESQRLHPTNPDLYHQRARAMLLVHRLEYAVEDYEIAVKLTPSHAITAIQNTYAKYQLSIQASTDDNRGISSSIMKEFVAVIERFPNCVDCYTVMAQVLTDQRKFEEADKYFSRAFALAPNYPMLLVHYAIMMLQWHSAVDTAAALLQRALEVDDKCMLAYETLGALEVQRGNLSISLDLFNMAIRYAKTASQLEHLFALRNAAQSQINVIQKLDTDMNDVAQRRSSE